MVISIVMLVYQSVFNYIQLTKIRDESWWINQTFPAHESLIKQHLAHNRVTLGFSGLGEGWKYGLFHWISPLHEIKSQSLQVLKKKMDTIGHIYMYIYTHVYYFYMCSKINAPDLFRRLRLFHLRGMATRCREAWPPWQSLLVKPHLPCGKQTNIGIENGHKNVDLLFKNGDFPKLC